MSRLRYVCKAPKHELANRKLSRIKNAKDEKDAQFYERTVS
jgi:hypothetical protein